MKTPKLTRRQALAATSAGALGAMATWSPLQAFDIASGNHGQLAATGGQPVRMAAWPEWPIWDPSAEEDVLTMLRSGKWWRGKGESVEEFEKMYAELLGAKGCVATASGTTALATALQVAGVDAGDEVLVSPYTFIATYNVIFLNKALPVFVDTDPETFLMNTDKIEERITDRTTAILPVHIFGLPVDMNGVNKVAEKHQLPVVEDACQAWLAEYDGKKAGTLGNMGCFSFQNSKNLPAGEGGAIVSNDEALLDKCWSLHNCGRPYGVVQGKTPIPTRGTNRRMQQIQAITLMSQMKRIKTDADVRLENAQYLDAKLAEIPGIIPYKLAKGATRSAYHLYPFRYKKEAFHGADRSKFIRALQAEGIPCYSGYGKQNKYEIIDEALNSRGYQRLYSKERLDRWREENVLPGNDQLCEEAVCFFQNMLLGTRKDMDDIVNAISKIYENRNQL
ncbi:MAG: DegT/DnrJ/EryC1/StrS family aminotransferase [Cyclobacteriaceae bacterium]|nr:DegT/DnrJ/EryC1/StrS family aminotransferase [Cyclobacteriaceae bacterium]